MRHLRGSRWIAGPGRCLESRVLTCTYAAGNNPVERRRRPSRDGPARVAPSRHVLHGELVVTPVSIRSAVERPLAAGLAELDFGPGAFRLAGVAALVAALLAVASLLPGPGVQVVELLLGRGELLLGSRPGFRGGGRGQP